MSLYIFGKCFGLSNTVLVKDKMSTLCTELGISLFVDDLDNEDKKTLDDATSEYEVDDANSETKFYFVVSSAPNDVDATQLWIEAQQVATKLLPSQGVSGIPRDYLGLSQVAWQPEYYKGMRACRLAQFIDSLGVISTAGTAALAVVDGGVERIIRAPALECIEDIFHSMTLSWDRLPNALYVLR